MLPNDHRCFEVKEVANKGRGLVATAPIGQGHVIFATPTDISVLYSQFGSTQCARCSCTVGGVEEGTSEANEGEPTAYVCSHCDQLVLCSHCVHALLDEVTMTNSDGSTTVARDAANCDDEATSQQPKPQHHELLSRHPRLRVHALACAWYGALPASVRAKGMDTDMLRFCLEYGALCYYATGGDASWDSASSALSAAAGSPRATTRCSPADEAALRVFAERAVTNLDALDIMADSQSDAVVQFCTSFARDKMVKSFGPGGSFATPNAPPYPVSAETLRDVLLRTQVNSLGFPFSEQETLGWSLERTVCMLNHSCAPNTAILPAHAPPSATAERLNPSTATAAAGTQPTRGGGEWISIVAMRDVAPGEELTISYVDLPTYGADVRERSRVLLERYRFLCVCERCQSQRAALRQSSAGATTAASRTTGAKKA